MNTHIHKIQYTRFVLRMYEADNLFWIYTDVFVEKTSIFAPNILFLKHALRETSINHTPKIRLNPYTRRSQYFFHIHMII